MTNFSMHKVYLLFLILLFFFLLTGQVLHYYLYFHRTRHAYVTEKKLGNGKGQFSLKRVTIC